MPAVSNYPIPLGFRGKGASKAPDRIRDLTVEILPVSTLKPYARNPRTHSAGYDHDQRLSRFCGLACSPRKVLVAKRQWYCQIGRKRRARAETANWRTKASPATRCDHARLQSPGDSEGNTPR
jgi:hypothetical protein